MVMTLEQARQLVLGQGVDPLNFRALAPQRGRITPPETGQVGLLGTPTATPTPRAGGGGGALPPRGSGGTGPTPTAAERKANETGGTGKIKGPSFEGDYDPNSIPQGFESLLPYGQPGYWFNPHTGEVGLQKAGADGGAIWTTLSVAEAKRFLSSLQGVEGDPALLERTTGQAPGGPGASTSTTSTSGGLTAAQQRQAEQDAYQKQQDIATAERQARLDAQNVANDQQTKTYNNRQQDETIVEDAQQGRISVSDAMAKLADLRHAEQSDPFKYGEWLQHLANLPQGTGNPLQSLIGSGVRIKPDMTGYDEAEQILRDVLAKYAQVPDIVNAENSRTALEGPDAAAAKLFLSQDPDSLRRMFGGGGGAAASSSAAAAPPPADPWEQFRNRSDQELQDFNDAYGPKAMATGGNLRTQGPAVVLDLSTGQPVALIGEKGDEQLRVTPHRPGDGEGAAAAQGELAQMALGGIVRSMQRKPPQASQVAFKNPYGPEAPGIYGRIGIGTNSDPNPNRPGLAQAKAGALDIAQRLRAGARMFDYSGDWERAHAGMGTIPADYAGRPRGSRGGVGGAPAARDAAGNPVAASTAGPIAAMAGDMPGTYTRPAGVGGAAPGIYDFAPPTVPMDMRAVSGGGAELPINGGAPGLSVTQLPPQPLGDGVPGAPGVSTVSSATAGTLPGTAPDTTSPLGAWLPAATGGTGLGTSPPTRTTPLPAMPGIYGAQQSTQPQTSMAAMAQGQARTATPQPVNTPFVPPPTAISVLWTHDQYMFKEIAAGKSPQQAEQEYAADKFLVAAAKADHDRAYQKQLAEWQADQTQQPPAAATPPPASSTPTVDTAQAQAMSLGKALKPLGFASPELLSYLDRGLAPPPGAVTDRFLKLLPPSLRALLNAVIQAFGNKTEDFDASQKQFSIPGMATSVVAR